MTIDSLQYSGICTCGRDHRMETRVAIIESGCLKELGKHLSGHGICGYTVAIYDENTYLATHGRHPAVDKEIILGATNLHADERGVAKVLEELPENVGALIAIGSGTVHDITRYCAHAIQAEFISCPTAASVDGFCSSVAAMTWNGCKKTFPAKAPRIVVADTDIFMNAPLSLTRSGIGDMIGKYIALADWRIANILTDEFYCERIAGITLEATRAVLESACGIMDGQGWAYEKLMYGLLLSGIAMQMTGNSRPASGAEHHISHLIEISPPKYQFNSHALHGEKVGVGTLLVLEEYRRLCAANISFLDYREYDRRTMTDVFGVGVAEEIARENEGDVAAGVTAQILESRWSRICAEVDKLPDLEELKGLYMRLGIKSTLSDIGVDEALAGELLDYSPMVRNRLTLMRLRRAISSTNKA